MDERTTERLVNLTTVLCVAVVCISGVNAFFLPNDPEVTTEFYLLTGDSSGELTADTYPENFEDVDSLYLGIENHREVEQRYTVVVQVQTIDTTNETLRIVDRENVDSIEMTVDGGSRQVRALERELSAENDGSRVVFLLYRGDSHPNPSLENAHRSTYIWVDD